MALVAFSIPILIVVPVNLVAFGLMVDGLILQGILMQVLAKLLGTLLVSQSVCADPTAAINLCFLELRLHYHHSLVTLGA
jgi:hypothetical protein